jgi:ribokinase
VRVADRPTGLAAIMVAEAGENLIAVASGANWRASAAAVPDERLGPATLLVAQMEVPAEETAAMIGRVRAAGGRVLLNLAPALPVDPALLPQIDLLVANAGEAAALEADPAALARRLRQGLVVTTGAAGATAFLADGGRLAVPALPVAAVDTTGAGDTFVGVLAAALDRRVPLEAALRHAAAAAGLACLGRGAQAAMPDRAAIDRAAARLPPP